MTCWTYDPDLYTIKDEAGWPILTIDEDGKLAASDAALAAFADWLIAEGPARIAEAKTRHPLDREPPR